MILGGLGSFIEKNGFLWSGKLRFLGDKIESFLGNKNWGFLEQK
jgi:hypothetical protein